MTKNIVTIGMEIPGGQTTYVLVNSKSSLLDYDIAVINPHINALYGYHEEYQGKPCLSDSDSFQLREHIDHWRREIAEALKAGKTVYILLNEKEEVFVATGQKSYSGTGRNQRTTRHVVPFSNYEIIPDGLRTVNSKGTSMKLPDKADILASYWAEFEEYSEYRVLIDSEDITPLVITKSGNKSIGALRRYKNMPGALILLPHINFERDDFTVEKKNEIYWSDAAVVLGKKLVSSLVQIDKALKQATDITPTPGWVNQKKYVLYKEQKTKNDLLTLETKIEKLQGDKERKQRKLVEDMLLKNLLFEKGKPLEAAILESLRTLGFKATQYRDTESEFDVVFECPEGRLIGEAEGKDNKPINIDKLRQLEMNIHEDFAREGISEMAKGALIGNAFRLSPLESRGDFFTDKCLTAAERSKTALIRSVDLFFASRYLSANDDPEFAKNCRQAILIATGIVVFPAIHGDETPTPEDVIVDSSKESNA
jgi:hypothetical protein